MSLTARTAVGAALIVAAMVSACGSDRLGASWTVSAGAGREPGPVAVVNRTPISEADLAVAMAAAARAGDPHQGGSMAPPSADRDQVLDQLIDEELAAQRAGALGLALDPELQAEVARRQAEVDRFRRQALAALLVRDARDHAPIAEADLRRYYAEHAEKIQTVIHVQQILLRDRTAIEAAHRELDAGVAFEAVAARRFPALPAGTAPWELGELRWNQVPAPWDGIVDRVAVGGISQIIEGPRGRLWIVKVVGRRTDPAITFDAARTAIDAALRETAATSAHAQLERTLRTGARIERPPIAGGTHGP